MTVVKGREVETPELDRFLKAIEPEKVNDTLSSFIDWLDESGYMIIKNEDVTYSTGKRCPNEACERGIDLRNVSLRQRQVFRELTRDQTVDYREAHSEIECSVCEGTGFVRHRIVSPQAGIRFPRPAELIAAFLGLDEKKMEDERRALLEALRQ